MNGLVSGVSSQLITDPLCSSSDTINKRKSESQTGKLFTERTPGGGKPARVRKLPTRGDGKAAACGDQDGFLPEDNAGTAREPVERGSAAPVTGTGWA